MPSCAWAAVAFVRTGRQRPHCAALAAMRAGLPGACVITPDDRLKSPPRRVVLACGSWPGDADVAADPGRTRPLRLAARPILATFRGGAITAVLAWPVRARALGSKAQGGPMGDKSPKSKDKAKKQGEQDKNQKKAAAAVKATRAPAPSKGR